MLGHLEKPPLVSCSLLLNIVLPSGLIEHECESLIPVGLIGSWETACSALIAITLTYRPVLCDITPHRIYRKENYSGISVKYHHIRICPSCKICHAQRHKSIKPKLPFLYHSLWLDGGLRPSSCDTFWNFPTRGTHLKCSTLVWNFECKLFEITLAVVSTEVGGLIYWRWKWRLKPNQTKRGCGVKNRLYW